MQNDHSSNAKIIAFPGANLQAGPVRFNRRLYPRLALALATTPVKALPHGVLISTLSPVPTQGHAH